MARAICPGERASQSTSLHLPVAFSQSVHAQQESHAGQTMHCAIQFASYLLADTQDAARVALQLGHSESRTLFAHYRELVKPEEAKAFWRIYCPLDEQLPRRS